MSRLGPSTRVLVTGAGGFVGPWLVEELGRRLPPGSAVIAAGQHAGPGSARAPTAAFDICDPKETGQAIRDTRPTALIHLAAVTSLEEARQDSRRAWDVNLGGTLNLAEALRREAPEARFVFVSTSEVYGAAFRNAAAPLDEGTPLDPLSVYGATKAAAELALGPMTREGLDTVRFRPFNHTGPGQTPRFAVPSFASQIVAIERGTQPPVIRVGNLDAERDFLDVRDVVSAYAAAVLADRLPQGAVMNLASGRPRRIGDVLEALLSRARVAIRIEVDPARLRPSDTPLALGDARRAETLLGWRPVIPWERTLADVLDFQRRAA